ncbi:MAG: GFA family protein [Alphaproteobacteria bacterium]|nr:GFA family protein [Alphaproteobacteria bacterium]
MRVSGQCLCGAVRYRGDAEPQFQVKCYCTDCRKSSAAGHAAMMGFAREAIEVKGEVKEFHSKADSGNGVMRAFCPTCGAGVYAKNAAMPTMIFLRASTLDDPDLFSPQLVVYASRAPAWDPVNQGLQAFAESPPRG